MKIIISEKELIKEIRKMLNEVSSQISTSFSAANMFGKSFKDGAAQQFLSRSDSYAKSSTLKTGPGPDGGQPYVARFEKTPGGGDIIYLQLKGKFAYGVGAGEELTVIFPIDKVSAGDKKYNWATQDSECINDPLGKLLLFWGKGDKKWSSFYPEGEATITKHLENGNTKKLLNDEKNVDHLVYSIVQKGLENIEKLTISANVKKKDVGKIKELAGYLDAYKKHFKDSAKAIIDAITGKIEEKKETGIEIDKTKPFIVKDGIVSLNYINHDKDSNAKTFKFSGYRDINKDPLGDWKDFIEYLKGNSEELKEDSGPKVVNEILQNESGLKEYWDPDKIKK